MGGPGDPVYGRREFLRALAIAGGAAVFGPTSLRAVTNLLGPFDTAEAAAGPLETTEIRLPAPDPCGVGPVSHLWPHDHAAMVASAAGSAARVGAPGDIRVLQFPSTCQVPLYIAEEFLYREGFTKVRYVPSELGIAAANLARGEVDIGMNFAGPNLLRLEAGDPIVVLAGGHVGCFELFASGRVRTIRDLKGKRIAIGSPIGEVEHVFLSAILAYIGLNPEKDVTWVIPDVERWADKQAGAINLLKEDKVDAYLAFPPNTLDLRARKIGHVVLRSATERPWSQYFCCMVIAHREFVRLNPIATKRALRAILKAADLVGREPARAARLLAERFKGMPLHGRYDYALQLMRELPYGRWREFDPEDTLRFYALRLREAGLLKSTPQQLLARGSNWQFLKELKKEMG